MTLEKNKPTMKTSSLSKPENIVLTPAEFAAIIRFGDEWDRIQFLNLSRLPGRLTVQESAWLLGFKAHDIPVLVRHRLLQPLGAPAKNGEKHFPAAQLERLSKDFGWMDLATATLSDYWKWRNEGKTSQRPQNDAEILPSSAGRSHATTRRIE
jgi:hypothetical protein